MYELESRLTQSSRNRYSTDEELVSDCYDLVRTGSTSTADATMLVTLYVLLYPDVQRKMLLEIDERIGREKPPTVEDRKRLTPTFYFYR